MNMLNDLSLIFISFCLVLFASCVRQDDFEEISKSKAEKIDFPYYGVAFEEAKKQDFEIKEKHNKYQLVRNRNKSYFLKYPISIMDINKKFIAVRTGVSTLDAGWKYLVFPTYSEILVFYKKDIKLKVDIMICDRVDKISLQENYVYFSYGRYPDLKYGRYPLGE